MQFNLSEGSNKIGILVLKSFQKIPFQSLRLSLTALGDTAPGKIVNLLSNDVNRFDVISMFLHSIWLSVFNLLIIGYILWTEVQFAGLIGFALVLITTFLQSYAGKL